MKNRFALAIVVVVGALAILIYGAVNATAKSVVTVSELLSKGQSNGSVRLGARVAEGAIAQESEPVRRVSFFVRDISGPEDKRIKVTYEGFLPDTLKVGRDVILEGTYSSGEFAAKNLVTQCPSKYVPPKPGESRSRGAYATEHAEKE